MLRRSEISIEPYGNRQLRSDINSALLGIKGNAFDFCIGIAHLDLDWIVLRRSKIFIDIDSKSAAAPEERHIMAKTGRLRSHGE